MSRYVAIIAAPKSWDSHDGYNMGSRPSMTVHDADDAPQATGLVDALGVPLYRLSDRIPIGFKVERKP